MRTINRPVYYCDHCNKYYLSKYYATKHEKICHNNPENERACFNCKYLEKKTTYLYFDTPNGECSREIDILFCSKLEKGVYPPKVELKGNSFDLADYMNTPMPKECDDFILFNYCESI